MIDNPLNRLSARRGEDCHNAKLTAADVISIRTAAAIRAQYLAQAKVLSNARLAEQYGDSKTTIEKAINGENWGHV